MILARYPQPPSPMYDQPPAAPSGSPDFNGEDKLSLDAPSRLDQSSDGAGPLAVISMKYTKYTKINMYVYQIPHYPKTALKSTINSMRK